MNSVDRVGIIGYVSVKTDKPDCLIRIVTVGDEIPSSPFHSVPEYIRVSNLIVSTEN